MVFILEESQLIGSKFISPVFDEAQSEALVIYYLYGYVIIRRNTSGNTSLLICNCLYNSDVKKFTDFCKQVLKEKKTDNPAMWQAALAHIAFLDRDYAKAIEMIEKACNMDGDQIVKDNARFLRLVYHAADTKASNYDDLLYVDLPWLLKKVNETDEYYSKNGNGYAHFINIR